MAKQQEQKEFKLNDQVIWESQASATTKEKRGRVIAVIPKGDVPTDRKTLEQLNPNLKYREQFGYGQGRDHQSYIILVPSKTGRSKPTLYWPRVKHLRLRTAADLK